MNIELRHRLYTAQVEEVYKKLPAGLLVNIINSSLLFYILWENIAYATLITWWGSIVSITTGRYISYHCWNKKKYPNSRYWGNIYIFGLFMAGVAWGSAGVLLFPGQNPAYQILVTFVLGGMVAGAIVSSASLPNAFYFYVIPALGPVMYSYFFLYWGEIGNTMCLMILLFGCFSVVTNHRVHQMICDLIVTRIRTDEESRARKDAEVKARQYQDFLETVLYNMQDGIVACDEKGQLTVFNRITEEFLGIPQLHLPLEDWTSHYRLYKEDGNTLMQTEDIPLFRAFHGEHVRNQEMHIMSPDGKKKIVSANGQPLIDEDDKKIGAVVSLSDITEVKNAQKVIQNAFDALEMTVQDRTEELVAVNRELRIEIEERRKAEQETLAVIAQLKEALSQVKTLRGFLPICASCKKIRDDQGYWKRIEEYIEQHSEAEFSHGMCPECFKERYPEDYAEIYGKDKDGQDC